MRSVAWFSWSQAILLLLLANLTQQQLNPNDPAHLSFGLLAWNEGWWSASGYLCVTPQAHRRTITLDQPIEIVFFQTCVFRCCFFSFFLKIWLSAPSHNKTKPCLSITIGALASVAYFSLHYLPTLDIWSNKITGSSDNIVLDTNLLVFPST